MQSLSHFAVNFPRVQSFLIFNCEKTWIDSMFTCIASSMFRRPKWNPVFSWDSSKLICTDYDSGESLPNFQVGNHRNAHCDRDDYTIRTICRAANTRFRLIKLFQPSSNQAVIRLASYFPLFLLESRNDFFHYNFKIHSTLAHTYTATRKTLDALITDDLMAKSFTVS